MLKLSKVADKFKSESKDLSKKKKQNKFAKALESFKHGKPMHDQQSGMMKRV